MTGWRLGFVCAPEYIIQAMLNIHEFSMISTPSLSQYAAIEALKNRERYVNSMKESYHLRRDFMVKSLNEIGLQCHLPGGAIYVFPSVHSTGVSSEEFAEKLLFQEKVAVVPGNVFGISGEGHIRCSYASSIDSLEKATNKIKRFLERLQ